MLPVSLTLDPAFRVGPSGVPPSGRSSSVSAGASAPASMTPGTRPPSRTGPVATSSSSRARSAVLPRHNSTAALVDGRLTVQVPPVSWNVVRLGS
jgi:hypothetical protein